MRGMCPGVSPSALGDLETKSLYVLSVQIVEMGALIHGSRGMSSSVVHPGQDTSSDDAAVHSIPHDELPS